jgi:hypothetical protein
MRSNSRAFTARSASSLRHRDSAVAHFDTAIHGLPLCVYTSGLTLRRLQVPTASLDAWVKREAGEKPALPPQR